MIDFNSLTKEQLVALLKDLVDYKWSDDIEGDIEEILNN